MFVYVLSEIYSLHCRSFNITKSKNLKKVFLVLQCLLFAYCKSNQLCLFKLKGH